MATNQEKIEALKNTISSIESDFCTCGTCGFNDCARRKKEIGVLNEMIEELQDEELKK